MSVVDLNKQLNTLNEKQLKAVKHTGSPLFVVAGAGTGKTNTLTTKIAYLIEKLEVNPENILAVTFTNKAAREIRDRVNSLIFPKQIGSWLYTFHAFALRILRTHASDLEIGYSNDFKIIDEDDATKIVKEAIDKLELDTSKYKPRAIRSLISKHKTKIDYLIETEEIDIYEIYQKELIRNGLMDFDDLLVYTERIFRTKPEILKIYQNNFKYILVDEFQDTDKIQYSIIRLLNSKNTFVVGDPDQSIYAFRGARYENNENFIKDFDADVVVLDLNYRSTTKILDFANKVISNNFNRTTSKDLVSELGEGFDVNVREFYSNLDEVNFVTNELIRLVDRGIKPDEIAILYRNNALSRSFEHSLNTYGIPYVIYGGISFYERKEVKDILAYINVLVSGFSDFYLKRIINVPARKLGKITVEKLEAYARNNHMSMLDAIPYLDNVNAPTKKRLLEFREMIINLREEILEVSNLVEIVDLVVKKTNYNDVLANEAEEIAKERRDNIYELKNVFYEANDNSGNNLEKIKLTLDNIALMTSVDNKDSENTVKLATIHQVKGLEFKVVFVVSLENDIFPNFRSTIEERKMEEERRLFYVAITRAKERLYLTHAKERFLFGQVSYQTRSIFLDEVLKDLNKETEIKKVPTTKDNNSLYKAGDVIIHNTFGKGVVINVKDKAVLIAFSHEHGIKTISETFKGMRKEKEDD